MILHPDLDRYEHDPRSMITGGSQDFQKLFLYATDQICKPDWHWLKFHFSFSPPNEFAESLVTFCLVCEYQIDGLGKKYIDQIASVCGRNRNRDDYQTILQVFAEILVLAQVFSCLWPRGAVFEYEPAGLKGKRPELIVRVQDKRYIFEVKAPSLLDHQEQRKSNDWQLPGRILPREAVEMLGGGDHVTLPRDNPVKDFLISAEEKFSDFPSEPGANILVIVWDDYIYEPVTALGNERSGLLTEQSYLQDNDGESIVFQNIDGVVVIRHLTYFMENLAGNALPDRDHAFDYGTRDALPNVMFPTRWGREIPGFISNGLRAVDYRSDDLSRAAEYRSIDVVMWV